MKRFSGKYESSNFESYDVRLTPAIWKFKFFKLLYWELVNLSRPVVSSSVAPVADWYTLRALVAIKRVVPNSVRIIQLSYATLTTVIGTAEGVAAA
jgi:hypothetical protein